MRSVCEVVRQMHVLKYSLGTYSTPYPCHATGTTIGPPMTSALPSNFLLRRLVAIGMTSISHNNATEFSPLAQSTALTGRAKTVRCVSDINLEVPGAAARPRSV